MYIFRTNNNNNTKKHDYYYYKFCIFLAGFQSISIRLSYLSWHTEFNTRLQQDWTTANFVSDALLRYLCTTFMRVLCFLWFELFFIFVFVGYCRNLYPIVLTIDSYGAADDDDDDGTYGKCVYVCLFNEINVRYKCYFFFL